MIPEEVRLGMENAERMAEEEAQKLDSRVLESRWTEDYDGYDWLLHLTLAGDPHPPLTLTIHRKQLEDQDNIRTSIHGYIENRLSARRW